MSVLTASGIVICVGSVLFLIAAFSPVSRVYGAPTAGRKLEIISGSIRGWRVSQVLFSLGAIVTALGVGLAGFALWSWLSAVLLYLPALLLAVGAVFWSRHVYLRAVNPGAFVAGALPAWHFILYTLLTIMALGLMGIVLLRLGFPAWEGWVLMAGSMLVFVLYLVFKDMPPFVHYVLGLILGIALIRGG